jgi:hypothetical protein
VNLSGQEASLRRSMRCCGGCGIEPISNRKLGSDDDADRRFVRVLAAVLSDGLDAVEGAVREALVAGAVSDEVILNILSRRREPPRPDPSSRLKI